MYVPIVKKRTVAVLSANMSNADKRAEIAKIMQIPESELPEIDFDDSQLKMKAHSKAVEEIIAEYKSKLSYAPKVSKDKADELYDIGRFIYSANNTEPLDTDFKLNVPEEFEKYPDFTLLIGDKRIGVEHTRLINEGIKKMLKAAKYYFTKAENELKDIAYLSKTVSVFVDYNKAVIGGHNFLDRKFTKSEREQIPQLIANYIRSEIMGNTQPKPDFIDRISISYNEDSRIDIELIDEYFTETNFLELLLNPIKSKEDKADKYRKAVNVDKLWLLIVVDDNTSSSGYNLEPVFLPQIANSNFDNILLFEKFGGEIIPLFPSGHSAKSFV